MKVNVTTKMTREVDTDHIIEFFNELIQETEDSKVYVSVPVSSLKDAAGVIEVLVADRQKHQARIKEAISQCDKLFDEKKTLEKQRDELANKLAELAAEKINKSGLFWSDAHVECKCSEDKKAVKEFNQWFYERFGDVL